MVLRSADGLGVSDAGDDVLALGIHQKVAIELLGAVGRVARKGDAGRRGLALVAKGHGLDVDGGAELVGNAVLLAVDAGALVHPAAKDGLDGKAQLELRIVREDGLTVGDLELGIQGRLDVIGENTLERLDKLLQALGRKLGIDANAGDQAGLGQGILEQVGIDTHDDVGEHLDKAAVAIPGKARVLRLGDKALDGIVVEAQVENRVHHAGHGLTCAGTDGDQQRVLVVAEGLAGDLLEALDVLEDVSGDLVVDLTAVCVILGAGLGGDGEALRHRHAGCSHLSQTSALAAQNVLHGDLVAAKGIVAFAEVVQILFAHACLPPIW